MRNLRNTPRVDPPSKLAALAAARHPPVSLGRPIVFPQSRCLVVRGRSIVEQHLAERDPGASEGRNRVKSLPRSGTIRRRLAARWQRNDGLTATEKEE